MPKMKPIPTPGRSTRTAADNARRDQLEAAFVVACNNLRAARETCDRHKRQAKWAAMVTIAEREHTKAWQPLILEYVLLAKNFVGKILVRYRNITEEDLMQEAMLGLMKAAEHFDPRKGCRFITLASWWIMQSVTRAAKESCNVIKIPGHHWDMMAAQRRGEALDEGKTVAVGKARKALEMVQWPEKMPKEGGRDGGDRCWIDWFAFTEDEMKIDVFEWELVERWLKTLHPRYREIVYLRFGLGGEPEMTLDEAGKRLGITRERVRQMQEKAMRKLELCREQWEAEREHKELRRKEAKRMVSEQAEQRKVG